MKRLYVFIILLFLISCSRTILKTGSISEENNRNMSSLEVGMNSKQVLNIMGRPDKIEEKKYENETFVVWYYITEPMTLGQSELITRNLTPLVFEMDRLIGWGRKFYNYTFDINDEKWKRQEEKNQQFSDDKTKWPRNEHAIILPMNESKKEGALEETKEKDLMKILNEIEKPKEDQNQFNDADKKPENQTKKKNKRNKRFKVNNPKKAEEPADSRCKNRSKDEKEYIFWE